MTITQALDVSNRTVSFRDAEVLLAAVLKCSRAHLHTYPEQTLTSAEETQYESFLTRREQNEPVAHITGNKEFYGREFKIDHRALIPRPETEGIVTQAVEWISDHFKTHAHESNLPCPVQVAELGTGCGSIAISVALELAERAIPATIVASEISNEALELAKENWETLSRGVTLGNVVLKLVQADMFDAPELTKRPFDIILANLPYVEDTWKMNPAAQQDVVFYEPDIALFGGSDGLDLYRKFFAESPTHLEKDGAIIIEYGETQTPLILPIISEVFPKKTVTVHKDYAGLDRVISIV